MITALKRALFEEPRAGNGSDWLFFVMAGAGVAIGCLMIVSGVLFSDFSATGGPSYSPMLIVLGAKFAFQSAAELLPKGWRIPAGLLRVGPICIALAGLILISIP